MPKVPGLRDAGDPPADIAPPRVPGADMKIGDRDAGLRYGLEPARATDPGRVGMVGFEFGFHV